MRQKNRCRIHRLCPFILAIISWSVTRFHFIMKNIQEWTMSIKNKQKLFKKGSSTKHCQPRPTLSSITLTHGMSNIQLIMRVQSRMYRSRKRQRRVWPQPQLWRAQVSLEVKPKQTNPRMVWPALQCHKDWIEVSLWPWCTTSQINYPDYVSIRVQILANK